MANKIFVINAHSNHNAGDSALLLVTIKQLELNFPGWEILISMNDPESFNGSNPIMGSFFTWVLVNMKWDFLKLCWLFPAVLIPLASFRIFKKGFMGFTPPEIRNILNSYIESDLVVSTAGGFVRSTGKGVALLLIYSSLMIAIFLNKPLYIFPQSIGTFRFWWEQKLAQWIYNRARLTMAREPISLNNLLNNGVQTEKCRLLPDVAFGFVGDTRIAAQKWLAQHGVNISQHYPLIGMTIMDWSEANPNFKRQSDYEKAITGLIQIIQGQFNGIVLLLPQTCGPTQRDDDRIIARKIAQQMPEIHNSIFLIEEELTPHILQAILGEMTIVIGTRMHTNIFAMSKGVPFISIGYLEKSFGIVKAFGLEEWVIDINTVNKDILSEKFISLWEHKDQIRNQLNQKIPSIIQESKKAGILMAEDYKKLKCVRQ